MAHSSVPTIDYVSFTHILTCLCDVFNSWFQKCVPDLL